MGEGDQIREYQGGLAAEASSIASAINIQPRRCDQKLIRWSTPMPYGNFAAAQTRYVRRILLE